MERALDEMKECQSVNGFNFTLEVINKLFLKRQPMVGLRNLRKEVAST